jgi:hypothetical protein
MRRVLVVAAAALLTATVAVGAVAGASSPSKPMIPAIGIYTAELNPLMDYREAGSGGSVLSIFVETGSSSNACLATLNEVMQLAPGAVVGGLYCASRSPEIGGVKLHGVGLHVFFSSDVGEGAHLQINVYQEGAKFYRAPVPCEQVNCGG